MLMTCYTYNGKTLHEDELFAAIKRELKNNEDLKNLAAIIYKIHNPKTILDTLKIEGEEAQYKQKTASENERPYIATTKFITARHFALHNERLTPEVIEANRKINFFNEHKEEFNNDQEAAFKSFEEQLRTEKENNTVGTHIHKIISALLTSGKGSTEYKTALQELDDSLKDGLAKIITENDKHLSSENISGIRQKILETAEEVTGWIKSQWGNCEIYSEMPMLLKGDSSISINCDSEEKGMRKYDGIIGVADLVVIDKAGKIHIVDFKVCSRPYNEWYQAKINEVEYQLAIYRAILLKAGFSMDDIDLHIKPILFEKQNISSLDVQPTVNPLQSYQSRLTRTGSFTRQLNKLGIGFQFVTIDSKNTDLEKEIKKDQENLIGYYEDPKILTKQFFIDNNKVEPDKDNTGKIVGYKFWSRLEGTNGGYLRAKSLEEFTKEGGILDQYIKDLEESRNNVAKTIITEISEFKKEKSEPNFESGKTSFLRSDRNANRKQILQRYLGKYTNPEWRCLSEDLPPELIDKGILIFQKIGDNNQPIIDIVVLAEAPLTQNVLVNGNQTVLGKYKNDEEVKTLDIVPLKSQYRNVKAIESIAIINTLLGKNPSLFEDCSFGNVVVLNPNGQVSDQQGINVSQLLDNFDILCAKENGNVENRLRKLRIPTTYEYCMSELQTVLTSLGEDSDLKKLLSDIDNGTESLRVKKQNIQRLLKEMRQHYAQVRSFGIEGNDKIDLNDPVQVCYIILSQMNNYLHGIKIDFDGRIPRWGLSIGEVFSLLGVMFLGKQAQTDSDGDNIVGVANGMEFSSPRTTRSNTLRQLNAYYDVVYNEIRKQFTKQTNFVSNLTKEYIKSFGITHQLLESENLKIWERLLVHDGDKINPQLIIKNPYDKSNDLTEIDREFLKQWLWEVNKYLINDPQLDETWHYKDHEKEILESETFQDLASTNDGKYFLLPLTRSGQWQRVTHLSDFGFGKWFGAKWKDFEETYDPRQLHNERRKQIKQNDVVEMYNEYVLTPADRKALLDSVSNPYDFSFDLDYIALDVAFNTIRKRHFDNALMLTETVLTLMQFEQQTTGANMEDEKEAGRTQLKIIKGESPISEEGQKIAKPIGIIRQFNSFAVLACRPLTFLKELSFGMFTNFSRAWVLKFGSNALSLGSVTKALSIIWGQRGKKYANVIFGDGMLSDFYLCDQINRLYGIANEDLTRTSRNASMSRVGVLNNTSRWMYLAQSAPDYYNRLTLFIAKMIEDGCFEAHSLEPDGSLKYDWKKDKRFSELAKHGLNSDYSSPEYNKQKALYAKMCSEFEKGTADLIRWNAEKQKYEYGDIDQAYTEGQRASIKEVADTAYGFYDHESKSPINHKFLGLVFLQFQTFLSAKYNLWLKGSTVRGRNTAQGKFVEMERNGIKYYDKHIIDSNGKLLGVKATPETELTEEEKRTLLPTMEWQGDFVEGLIYSIGYTIHDIFTLNWKEIANNKQRLANVMLAMHDLSIGILLFAILKYVFSGGSGKMQDITPLKRTFLRGMQDVGPQALTQVSITPSFVNTWNSLKSDGIKLLSGSENAVEQITKHFGATRDFIWDEI